MELTPTCHKPKDREFSQDLQQLVRLSSYFQELDKQIKTWLPANLHAHFHVSCIEQNTLILHANLPAMASRLKMMLPALLPQIQQQNPHIQHIQVYVQPQNIAPKSPIQRSPDPEIAAMLANTANQVTQSPKLAQALRQLAKRLTP